jgi:hypothetical protein
VTEKGDAGGRFPGIAAVLATPPIDERSAPARDSSDTWLASQNRHPRFESRQSGLADVPPVGLEPTLSAF